MITDWTILCASLSALSHCIFPLIHFLDQALDHLDGSLPCSEWTWGSCSGKFLGWGYPGFLTSSPVLELNVSELAYSKGLTCTKSGKTIANDAWDSHLLLLQPNWPYTEEKHYWRLRDSAHYPINCRILGNMRGGWCLLALAHCGQMNLLTLSRWIMLLPSSLGAKGKFRYYWLRSLIQINEGLSILK